MPDSPSSLPEELLAAARRFNKASFSRNLTLSSGELNHGEWHLMWTLLHSTDARGSRPSDLARQLKVTAANVAQQLRNLEKQRLLVRIHDKDDRRVVLVRLTPKGINKLKQVRNEFVNHFEHLIAHLGAKETDHFIRLLAASADYLEGKESSSC